MARTLITLLLLFGLSSTSLAQPAKTLAGTYRMDVQGGDTLVLNVDGTATLAGETTTWSATDNRLSIGPDVMPYTLQGDRLILTVGPVQTVWKKVGNAKKGLPQKQKAATEKKAAQPETSTPDADREAKRVLTGSAWCSFTYNKTSGTSTTRKVIFRPDGVMTVNGGAETYSSGYGGTVAGQSSSANAMLWKLENLRLYVDQRDGAGFQDIGLTATKNSNGYVILHAGGREYSMCR